MVMSVLEVTTVIGGIIGAVGLTIDIGMRMNISQRQEQIRDQRLADKIQGLTARVKAVEDKISRVEILVEQTEHIVEDLANPNKGRGRGQ